MPAHKSLQATGDAIRRHLLLWGFPQLAALPAVDWERSLRRAREIDFDAFERVVLVAGVTAVAALLDFAPGDAMPMELFLHYVLVFLEALPLLALAVGPVCLRRIRRGLESEVAARRTSHRKEASHESDAR